MAGALAEEFADPRCDVLPEAADESVAVVAGDSHEQCREAKPAGDARESAGEEAEPGVAALRGEVGARDVPGVVVAKPTGTAGRAVASGVGAGSGPALGIPATAAWRDDLDRPHLVYRGEPIAGLL